jgi:hypothetical protein
VDPNTTLTQLRELIADSLAYLDGNEYYDAGALASLLDDIARRSECLDEWLTRGGFLPSDWER